MVYQPGHKKIPGSGRKKGQPNKSTLEMREACEARLGGISVPEWLIKKAVEAADGGDLQTAGNMAGKAAGFLYATLKAIEHSGAVESTPTLQVILEGASS